MNTETQDSKTYLVAIREAIVEEMENDDKVIFLGEDIGRYGGAFGVSRGLLERFGPHRIIDTPISENSIVGVATGAALTGLKPIVEFMFMDFMALAVDQILNHMSKIHYMYGGQVPVPLVLRAPSGGGRRYGASHSQSLESMFMHVPGLRIAAPSTVNDAKWLLRYAIQDPNPWLFVESKKLYPLKEETKDRLDIPVGTARIVTSGKDCTIVTYSRMVHESLIAVRHLKEMTGAEIELLDLRTLCPIDVESIYCSVRKTGRVAVVEEGCITSGVGAEIAARIAENCFEFLKRPILRIASPDTPVPASAVLEDVLIPSAQRIAGVLERFLQPS